MSRVAQNPPKFTHSEWLITEQTRMATAEAERSASERLVAETRRCVEETNQTTRRMQDNTKRRIEEKHKELLYWQKEARDKLEELKHEITCLAQFRSRADQALEACREPLHVAQQCLKTRLKRRGVDQSHDDPEKELVKEVETIQGVIAIYVRMLEQADEQLRISRKSRYDLNKELTDRMAAIGIDNHNLELRESSQGNEIFPDVSKISPASITPEQWIDFNEANLEEAENQRQNSASLRSLMDELFQQTRNDLQRRKDDCDAAFDRRIAEVRDIKEKLEDNLRRLKIQITEMEDNIALLEKSIANKESVLKLALTRLNNRTKRPNQELVRDQAQYGLIEEVEVLEETLFKLHGRLTCSRCSLKGLEQKKIELEDDIEKKTEALFIDETECMLMRQSVAYHIY